MLCQSCSRFCASVGHATRIVNSSSSSSEDGKGRGIQWAKHRASIHNDLADLKSASQSLCCICRLIWHGLTELERKCASIRSVDLDFDPSGGGMPMLYVHFVGASPDSMLSRRLLAMYGGELDSDELGSTLHDCARVENQTTGSESSFRLASFWLNECLCKHSSCPKPPLNGFIPSRVVDVGPSDGSLEPRLRDTRTNPIQTSDRSYAALSHCWGKERIITTTKATLEQRLARIPVSSLSQTFQDAMLVSRNLGVRYIWIDSLCIVQDDADDWAKESVQMCDIYRQAYFTIGAAHASGGSEGCFVEREGLISLPLLIEFQLPHQGDTLSLRTLFTLVPRNQPLDLVGLSEPPLYGRAWVLQEQILSPRMLIYEVGQVRWECLSVHGSEHSPLGGASRQAGYFKKIQKRISNTKDEFFHLGTAKSLYIHMDWCIAVMEYTHRGMTKASDRFVAIAGIAKAIELKTSNKYLWGIWSEHFWRGLLWNIPFANEYTPTTNFAYTIPDCSRHNETIAPTWSWASVTLPIVYPIPTISYEDLVPLCDIVDLSVPNFPNEQHERLTICGDTRIAYLKSAYSPSICKAHAIDPEEKTVHQFVPLSNDAAESIYLPGSRLSSERSTVKYDPDDFFLASLEPPNFSDFQLIPGTWRPDQILPVEEPVTFIAIARHPRSVRPGYISDEDPIEVYTLGLQRMNSTAEEYRRVGYAVWYDCAWYGYDCNGDRQDRTSGIRSRFDSIKKGARKVKRLVHSSGSNFRGEGQKPLLVHGSGTHDHSFRGSPVQHRSFYHSGMGVERKTVTIF